MGTTKISMLIAILVLSWQLPIIAQTTTYIDWHPGHYFAPAYNVDDEIVSRDTFFNAVNKYNFRGVQLRYKWPELETSKGVYNFSKLDADLSQLGPNKYMFMLLVIKTTSSTEHSVPKYMRNSEYGGGEWPYSFAPNQTTNKGYTPALWNTKVRARYTALITALAHHLKPQQLAKIEGVGGSESVMGYPLANKPPFDEDGYYNGYVKMLRDFKAQLPTKINYQFLNYPASKLNVIVSRLCDLKSALGSPDTYADEPGLLKSGTPTGPNFQGLYQYYFQNKKQFPLIASVQPMDFQGNRSPTNGPTYEPSLQQIRDFAVNELGANYLIWTWSKADFSNPAYSKYPHNPNGHLYWQDVISFMQKPVQNSDPTGGLNTDYPNCL